MIQRLPANDLLKPYVKNILSLAFKLLSKKLRIILYLYYIHYTIQSLKNRLFTLTCINFINISVHAKLRVVFEETIYFQFISGDFWRLMFVKVLRTRRMSWSVSELSLNFTNSSDLPIHRWQKHFLLACFHHWLLKVNKKTLRLLSLCPSFLLLMIFFWFYCSKMQIDDFTDFRR